MDEPEKMELTSMDVAAEKREQLKRCLGDAFPEVFAEGAIDFDQLKRVLGEWVEPDKERFGLNWPGKAKCMKIIQQPSIATLKPVREESVNFDETENVFIEGDNLEVLKLLQKSYFGKIKMIYIDPPYNTGNEFIYPDKFDETLQTYLAYTGQIDDENRKFSTLNDTNGRFHSRWLNMMYPRLYLAKNLMKKDGLIFISIDDNEAANLKILMNEVFGEENFVDCIVWKKRYGGGAKEKYLVTMHEYIFIYAKEISSLPDIFVPLHESQIERYYSNTDGNFSLRGPYRTHPLEAMKSFDERSNLKFPIMAPDGTKVWPKRQWRWSEERAKEALEKGEIEFRKGRDNEWVLSSKQYLKDENGEVRQTKAFSLIDDVYSQHGTNEIFEIFGDAKIFDFPKPVGLIKQLIKVGTKIDNSDIILDFFTGSASTCQAVIEQNLQDGGNRQFISVQLPEKIEEDSQSFKAGFKNIAQIGKERIKRFRFKYKNNQDVLKFNSEYTIDYGFKSFHLAISNFKLWNGVNSSDESLKLKLELYINHISELATSENILFELLLKAGYSLITKIETVIIAEKQVISIDNSALLICLEKEITSELIDALAEMEPQQVICLDEAFKGKDQLKANTVQTFKARAKATESQIVFKTV
jgi:adenine-specific DNA-methyltransferase